MSIRDNVKAKVEESNKTLNRFLAERLVLAVSIAAAVLVCIGEQRFFLM